MAYLDYETCTVDHTQCGSSNSTAFPVLVSITATLLKTVAHGGAISNTVTQSGGNAVTMPADLVFSADALGVTLYPWEIEFYDGTNGILVAWVQVPTLSHTADTVFYMPYGNVLISTQQNTGSYAPSAVWDTNYKGVWHLPDGTTLNLNDSTVTGNNGINNGATA